MREKKGKKEREVEPARFFAFCPIFASILGGGRVGGEERRKGEKMKRDDGFFHHFSFQGGESREERGEKKGSPSP